MLKSNVISVALLDADYEVVERLLNERAKLVEFIGSNRPVSGAILDESRRVNAITAELTHILGKNALAYAGGVVIQAGEAPQLGDTYRKDIPEAYRLVARYTKNIRFEAYQSRLFRVPEDLDNKEETLAWIRRFD